MTVDRHARQVLFRHVGRAGQARLAAARVLIVGVGATGGAVANALARAGVGHLTLVDRDYPELHNLQRQTLLDEADVRAGIPKAVAAAAHLRQIDSGLDVTAVVTDVHAGNILELLAAPERAEHADPSGAYDLIIDGTDNFATRYVLNDAAVQLGLPWVYSGAIGAHGAMMVIPPGGRPCFRCLHPDEPPPGSLETCDTVGVLQPAVAVVGGLAAMAALKLLLGHDVLPELLHVDAWDGLIAHFQVPARPDCPTCGRLEFPSLSESGGTDVVAATLCGRDAVHLRPARRPDTAQSSPRPPLGSPLGSRLDLGGLATRLRAATGVSVANEHLVRFQADGCEITVFADGRAIVQGTDELSRARSLYARWIGL